MSAWALLAVPICLSLVVLLLWGVASYEQRLLSPRSLILYTYKSRHCGPDTVEMMVASQSERLLRDVPRAS